MRASPSHSESCDAEWVDVPSHSTSVSARRGLGMEYGLVDSAGDPIRFPESTTPETIVTYLVTKLCVDSYLYDRRGGLPPDEYWPKKRRMIAASTEIISNLCFGAHADDLTALEDRNRLREWLRDGYLETTYMIAQDADSWAAYQSYNHNAIAMLSELSEGSWYCRSLRAGNKEARSGAADFGVVAELISRDPLLRTYVTPVFNFPDFRGRFMRPILASGIVSDAETGQSTADAVVGFYKTLWHSIGKNEDADPEKVDVDALSRDPVVAYLWEAERSSLALSVGHGDLAREIGPSVVPPGAGSDRNLKKIAIKRFDMYTKLVGIKLP